MAPHTYAAYEREPGNSSKAIQSIHKYAREWANLLEVDVEWLRDGVGSPWVEQQGRVNVEGLDEDGIALLNTMADQLRRKAG